MNLILVYFSVIEFLFKERKERKINKSEFDQDVSLIRYLICLVFKILSIICYSLI